MSADHRDPTGLSGISPLNPHLSRRALMLGAAAVAAGATLARWVPEARAAVGGQLDIMTWEGYTLQNEAAQWIKQNNLRVNASIMGSQDDVTAKLMGGGVRLDLSEYSNGYNELYKGLGLLKPIDVAQVPNYNPTDIISRFYDGDMWFWDGQRFGIPWTWGVDTIVINPQEVKEPVTSFKDLLRPEFKGRLTFLDNPLTVWPLAAKVTGHGDKFPNVSREDLADIWEQMIPYREQCRTFASSNGDVASLFVAKEISACFCTWTAATLQTAKQGVKTEYVFPKEGGAVWADAWFIPVTSVNVESALAFINQALDPQVQAEMSKAASSAVVNRKAVQYMDAATRSLFDYERIDEVLQQSPLKGQPPRESELYATYDDWLQAWASFRAGF
ncbi:ABC transporter substrate-binding protein [Pseudomonas putida]|uniref:ABC transporter substrate-binding protein n=1 Tax=Pseudomonas putida TaxID=303 RepID=UPI0023649CF7|nr:extracellular solute-binding protein [Pseudomonas putida]MDD2146791.1 extracellular solute-binding protein [Pseudomonas putida]